MFQYKMAHDINKKREQWQKTIKEKSEQSCLFHYILPLELFESFAWVYIYAKLI